MRRSLLAALMLLCIATVPAHAARIEQPLADAVQESRAQEIFHALRCVVCEGQSLAESDATLAVQMRAHIRTQLAAGQTPEEILRYFRTHYGERILMAPPLEPATILLWVMPLMLVTIGGIAVWRTTRRGEEEC